MTVQIRRARPGDGTSMARVHLASWRNTYAGILPDRYLTNLSVTREASLYESGLAMGHGGHAGFIAVADPSEVPGGGVIGFVTGGFARRPGIAEGEVETIYLLDDFRDRGIGRRLMRAMASHLASLGARSAFAWVLEGNNARFFYERLGARATARETIRFAGQDLPQRAYAWDPIHLLLTATAVPQPRPR